jgi:hypothetical protein
LHHWRCLFGRKELRGFRYECMLFLWVGRTSKDSSSF